MIIKNHLFLKISQGKPPFIGIAYDKECAGFAELTNEWLVDFKKKIMVYLEWDKHLLNVIVRREGMNELITYSPVDYKPGDLHAWLIACSKAKVINFGHVVKYDFGYTVAKTRNGNKNFYFPVEKIYVENREPYVISFCK